MQGWGYLGSKAIYFGLSVVLWRSVALRPVLHPVRPAPLLRHPSPSIRPATKLLLATPSASPILVVKVDDERIPVHRAASRRLQKRKACLSVRKKGEMSNESPRRRNAIWNALPAEHFKFQDLRSKRGYFRIRSKTCVWWQSVPGIREVKPGSRS